VKSRIPHYKYVWQGTLISVVIGLLSLKLGSGVNKHVIAWLGGRHPGNDNSLFETEDSSAISSLFPYNDAAGDNRHLSSDSKDQAQENGPAKQCKVVIMNVILPGGIGIQSVEMKPMYL
jgi:hypothetical protein